MEKNQTPLTRDEMKNIKGGSLRHYYCICGNGKTINGSTSEIDDLAEVLFEQCGDSSGECFFA